MSGRIDHCIDHFFFVQADEAIRRCPKSIVKLIDFIVLVLVSVPTNIKKSHRYYGLGKWTGNMDLVNNPN